MTLVRVCCTREKGAREKEGSWGLRAARRETNFSRMHDSTSKEEEEGGRESILKSAGSMCREMRRPFAAPRRNTDAI